MVQTETRTAHGQLYQPLRDEVQVAIKLQDSSNFFEAVADIVAVMDVNGDSQGIGADTLLLTATLGKFGLSYNQESGVAQVKHTTSRFIRGENQPRETTETLSFQRNFAGQIETRRSTTETDEEPVTENEDLSLLLNQLKAEYSTYHEEREFKKLSEYGEKVKLTEDIEGLQIKLTGKSGVSFYPALDKYVEESSFWANATGDSLLTASPQSLAEQTMENLRQKGISPSNPLSSSAEAKGDLIIYTDPTDGVRRVILYVDKVKPTFSPQLSIDDLDGLTLLGPRHPHRVRGLSFGGSQAHAYTTDRNGSRWSIHIDKNAALATLDK